MNYFLIPLAAILGTAIICFNFKMGFMVADATENTGFSAGFYMMTVLGLMAAETSLAVFIGSRFVS